MKWNSDTLEAELERSGILLNDPRINGQQLIAEEQRNGVITRALEGGNVLPNFEEFTADISRIYEAVKLETGGQVANYIPQLKHVDPDLFGVSLCTIDGQQFSIGDFQNKFSIQSTHKPINYAVALEELGTARVHQHIGKEASGVSFNALTLNREGLPHNPLINAGAITSLIMQDKNPADKFDHLLELFDQLTATGKPTFNNSVYLSERDTADRNFALAYFMRENGAFPEGVDIEEILDFYFQCCAIESTTEQMAKMAATFANSGINPFTNNRVFSSQTVKNCLTMMNTCGMYDFSGEFAFSIGLPAKSGVSGAIWIAVPNVMGIGIYAPPLDKNGNSVKGVAFAKALVNHFNFHAFDSLNYELDGKKDPRRKKYETKATEVMQMIFAASAGDLNEVKKICNGGISVNEADYDGRTALHLAAAENRPEVVEYLLHQGANITVQDRWGGTPLVDAQKANNREVLEIFDAFHPSNDNQ
ncbi:MAG: glutaminase A [Bacteroidota bacterium]